MADQVVAISLPNGATALARVASIEGATKTSALPDLDFKDVGETLAGLADVIRSSLENAAPDEVTVTLGLELAVKSGKLTGLLVEGQGAGSISITLRWGAVAGG